MPRVAEGVSSGVARRVGVAGDLPGVVDGVAGAAVRPAEGAEVGHRAARAGRAAVAEGVDIAAGRVGEAGDLPGVVDADAVAVRPAEGAEVVDITGGRCISNPRACHERRQQDDAINGSILCHERVFHFWSAVQSKSHRP